MAQEMTILFPGGDRVDARYDGMTVTTNQDGSSPAPFELFLASIGTCAGFYVYRFCRQRNLPTDGLTVRQTAHVDPSTGLIGRIELNVGLPSGFPDRYRDAIVRAAQSCAVKKHLERPPDLAVRIS